MNGLCLTPSAVIGLGAWGREVAREAEAALRERSPELVRACPVLTVDEDDPAVPEKIRAHLRASRMAETFRALQQDGLMQLDPVLSPATHVYLIAAERDTDLLRDVAELVSQAAAELKAAVTRIAFVDVGSGGLPGPIPGVQLYVMEPVTCQGLILDPAEYRAAAVEALLAAVQPGGGEILAAARTPGGPRLATLGIAWLTWSPADLRAELAHRLSRRALVYLLDAPEAADPLPLVWPVPDVPVFEPLPAGLEHRRDPALSLRRCAAVLERRAGRWERELGRLTARRQEQLDLALAEAAAGGLVRARAAAVGYVQAAERRLAERQPATPSARSRGVAAALEQLDRAEALPPVNLMAGALAFVGLVSIAVARLLGGEWPVLLTWGALLGLAAGAYAAWRPWRLRQAVAAAARALRDRAACMAESALTRHLEALDQHLAERAAALLREVDQASAQLRERCRPEPPIAPPAPAGGSRGALSFPLVGDEALEPFYRDQALLVPELAAHLASAGCFRHWREPDRVLEQAESLTRSFLGGRANPDPAQLATRAHGERLAERLQAAVRGLLDWSQPLLARGVQPLPEGRRWLVWPEGLPCPPLPPDVTLLPASRSCAAVLTVVHGVQAGTEQSRKRKSGESTA